jgi:hypothetical protein
LLLAFASTVIPGFSPLENHDQDFYSLLDMYVFRNGGLLFDDGGVAYSRLSLILLYNLGTDCTENVSSIIACTLFSGEERFPRAVP